MIAKTLVRRNDPGEGCLPPLHTPYPKNYLRAWKLFSIYCAHDFHLKCKSMPHFALSEFDAKCVRDFKTRSPYYFPLKCKSMLHFAP